MKANATLCTPSALAVYEFLPNMPKEAKRNILIIPIAPQKNPGIQDLPKLPCFLPPVRE